MIKLKNFYVLILFLVLLSFYGCDAIYRMLDKKGAQEKDLIGEVTPYESNPTVEEIQSLLKLYGYNPGNIDGVLGLKTRNAIEKFQDDNNLPVSRFADEATWNMLKIPKDYGLVRNSELEIKIIQYVLKELGYNPGKIDGKLGPGTISAVKSFQKNEKLKIDGKIGFQTLIKLISYIEVDKDAPN